MINLTTKLKAYPRIEPSMFSNYYTKDEADAKFVTEVKDPIVDATYARALVDDSMDWVNISPVTSILYYGIIDEQGGANFPTPSDLDGMQNLPATSDSIVISTAVSNSGYLWVCSDKIISEIIFVSPNNPLFNTSEVIGFMKDITITEELSEGKYITRTIHCYRTANKYAALGNVNIWNIVFA